MTPKNRLKTKKKRLVPHETFFHEKTIFDTLSVANDTVKLVKNTEKHMKKTHKNIYLKKSIE